MTRWKAFTKCIRVGCDGDIEFWLEELMEVPVLRARYRFCCTECDLQGPWELFAKQRKYRGDSGQRGTRVSGGTPESRRRRTYEAPEYGPEDF